MGALTRRDFMRGAGAVGLSLGLVRLQLGCGDEAPQPGVEPETRAQRLALDHHHGDVVDRLDGGGTLLR